MLAVRPIYDQSQSQVRTARSKSDLFKVPVGPCQGYHLSSILFITFTDRISLVWFAVECEAAKMIISTSTGNGHISRITRVLGSDLRSF